MLEMFATTVQAELNATLHVCESGLQDIRIFLGLVPKESPCILKQVFLQYLSSEVCTVRPIISRNFPSKRFPIHLLTTPPIIEMLTASLNKRYILVEVK
jgi:hypothetical protein